MIKQEIQVDTLEEYYKKLYELQLARHGQSFLLVHDEIKNRIKSCDSYTEFGVQQGTTLAVAVLAGLGRVAGYDIDLDWYNLSEELFTKYASKNNVSLRTIEADTATCRVIEPVDLLYIDSCHQPTHLQKELTRHGDNVSKYIIFHDTNICGMRDVVLNFASDDWNILVDNKTGVGFMSIERK